MKLSICIACVDKHIVLLEKFMDSIIYFTRKPDEVIVSLSPKFLKLDLLNEKIRLENKYNNLKCLVQETMTNASVNRNKCMIESQGDIIIIHDADDIMDSQKCEIIEKIFIKYSDTKMILHNLNNKTNRNYNLINKKYNLEDYKIYTNLISSEDNVGVANKEYEKDTNKIFGHNYVCGAVSIRKNVIENVLFENINYAEDAKFVGNVNRLYNKTIYIDMKLIDYISSCSW